MYLYRRKEVQAGLPIERIMKVTTPSCFGIISPIIAWMEWSTPSHVNVAVNHEGGGGGGLNLFS